MDQVGLRVISCVPLSNGSSTLRRRSRPLPKKDINAEAKGQKVTGDAFPAFVRQKCSAQTTSFKSAVWAFDSKNKVSRKQSESDSDLQIEDFVSSAQARYRRENQPR